MSPGDGATDFVKHLDPVMTADCGLQMSKKEIRRRGVEFLFSFKHRGESYKNTHINIKIHIYQKKRKTYKKPIKISQ